MLRRLINFIARPIADPAIEALYRTCIEQARRNAFYTDLQAPDTVDGRFDLLILHVILVLQRLEGNSEPSQQLFDILFADMDRNLREMGVSDVSIARKMKPMFSAFYGRAKIYAQALTNSDEALASALRRNIYGAPQPSPDALLKMTRYVRRAHDGLAIQKIDVIIGGIVHFPVVESL